MKILLVEDDPMLRRTMQHLISRWGYDVDAVDCGLAAIDAVKQQYYHVILLDEQLPDLSGRKAAAKIRDIEHEKPALIIGLTAYVDSDEYHTFLDAGMNEVLQKPLKREFFAATLARLTAS